MTGSEHHVGRNQDTGAISVERHKVGKTIGRRIVTADNEGTLVVVLLMVLGIMLLLGCVEWSLARRDLDCPCRRRRRHGSVVGCILGLVVNSDDNEWVYACVDGSEVSCRRNGDVRGLSTGFNRPVALVRVSSRVTYHTMRDCTSSSTTTYAPLVRDFNYFS